MKNLLTLFLLSASVTVNASQELYATCAGCHGANGEGGLGPKLTGQTQEYVTDKLIQYRSGEQIGPMTAVMAPMAMTLTDEDIANLSAYISKM
jgi:cytochrome c